jgi:hypothetical protein
MALAASTSRANDTDVSNIRSHIERLSKAKVAPADPQRALNDLRTVKLSRLIEGQASAEFFLVVSTGGKVDQASFISGSPKLKPVLSQLTKLKLDNPFPDDTPALIVRRGVLGCYATTGCSLVFLPSDAIR